MDKVFREMTKCHFVPHEGSTTQCDAGPTRRGRGWIGSGERFLSTPSALSARAPVSGRQSGEGWGGSYTQLVAVKVVAIAVRMVITTLRILPQRVLLLKVPILF